MNLIGFIMAGIVFLLGSSALVIRTPVAETIPTAPSNLAAATISSSQIGLTWDDNSSNETSFEVEYDTVNTFDDDPQLITGISVNAESRTVSDLAPDTEYFFRVRARSGAGASSYSAADSDTTDGLAGLTPGVTAPGSWTTTSNPGQQGSGNGDDEDAICCWKVIERQVYTTTFRVDVFAAHMNGIAKVQFIANNGTPVDVTTTSLNPITGMNAITGAITYGGNYSIDVEAAGSDGAVEVRAVIYPNVGMPVVLQQTTGLQIYSNASNTLNASARTKYVAASGGSDSNTGDDAAHPYATIGKALTALESTKDNAFIKLLTGTHAFPGAGWGGGLFPFIEHTLAWLTIMPSEGLTKDDVTINDFPVADRSDYSFLRLNDLTLTAIPLAKDTFDPSLWLDDCECVGGGKGDGFTGWLNANTWTRNRYATDTICRSTTNALRFSTLLINCTISDIGEDGFSDTDAAFGITLSDFEQQGGAHADVAENFNGQAAIWYNINYADGTIGTAQNINIGGGSNGFIGKVRGFTSSGNGFYNDYRYGDLVHWIIHDVRCPITSWSLPGDTGDAVISHVIVDTCFSDQIGSTGWEGELGVYPGVTYV